MIVLVTGSRETKRVIAVNDRLDAVHASEPITLLIHGACRGLDLICEQWAKANEVDYFGMPAKWRKMGKRAGPVRNRAMCCPYGIVPQKLLAFPGNVGTADMVKAATERGIPVERVTL